MKKIKSYEILPNGRAKNLQGEKGDFSILYRTAPPLETNKPQDAHWLCQCKSCQKYFVKPASSLKASSCTCECKNTLVGQTFGRWTVLYLCEERTKKRGKIYHCVCECGNEKNVPAEVLRNGESKSCGCFSKEQASKRCKNRRVDITGQRFGKLLALKPIYSEKKGTHTRWTCQCDCGNKTEIDLGNLRSGKSQSCGCSNSRQEESIIKILTKASINFKYQHRFKDLKYKEFDFFIEDKYIIEYDGEQHFKYNNNGWMTQEKFERTRKSDLEKNEYCFNNNIPIIRIPYMIFPKIEDLKLETTKYLLTPKNEKEYFERYF